MSVIVTDPPRRKYHTWIAFTYAGSLSLLFVFAVASFWFLSAIRAYVTGEGFWSKAQKDAVAHLLRFKTSGDQRDYKKYEAAIAVPLADHEARVAMGQVRGLPITCRDFGAACGAFIRAGNHPDDAVWMARLFYYANRVGYIHHAIEVWARADDYILQLQDLAVMLHSKLSTAKESTGADRAAIDAILAQIANVYQQLTPLEDDFSRTLGSGARQAVLLNTLVLGLATGGLIALSLLISRRMLKSLQTADERYRHYLDAAGDAIVITKPSSGQIIEVNQMAAELTGHPRQKLLTMRAAEILDNFPLDTNPFVEDGTPLSKEVSIRNAHGQFVLADVRSRITSIHDEEVILTILRDITEQHQFQQRSADAARLEMVGRLAGGIAHDFNNLLAGIMIYASDAHAEAPSGALREAFDEILKCSHSGAELVEHLLAFSRKQKLVQREFNLNDVVQGLIPLLQRLLGERIRLVTDLEPAPIHILADSAGVEQVITNLITNARDATPQGGIVIIRTRLVTPEQVQQMRPAALPDSDGVLLTIQDSGEGMDENTLARVFDPFFTTKPDGKGTGLGLSSVYGTVRQSAGDIWLTSKLQQGTTANILFPNVKPGINPGVKTPVRLAASGKER